MVISADTGHVMALTAFMTWVITHNYGLLKDGYQFTVSINFTNFDNAVLGLSLILIWFAGGNHEGLSYVTWTFHFTRAPVLDTWHSDMTMDIWPFVWPSQVHVFFWWKGKGT